MCLAVTGCFHWMCETEAAFDTVCLSILVRNSQTIQNHTFGAYEVDFITCKTLTKTYWGTMLETHVDGHAQRANVNLRQS